MKRSFYSASITTFLNSSSEHILGVLAQKNEFALEITQRETWIKQIVLLKEVLVPYTGSIFFEYSIPRMGRRIDVVLLVKNVIFVLEFKVGEKDFLGYAMDQAMDYAIDLKNFHETSHVHLIAPVLIATEAKETIPVIALTHRNDNVLFTIKSNASSIGIVISYVLSFADGEEIDTNNWEKGKYSPTPTIIEAAMALYNGHSVSEISRSDADATNLSQTSESLSKIIENARINSIKVICFVTGVPGAGKTLVGLDVATKQMSQDKRSSSVVLIGQWSIGSSS